MRIPGTAVFLNRGKETAPLAMRANVEHNHVLHRARDHHVDRDRAGAPGARRRADNASTISVTSRDGIIHVGARFGYMERPNVPPRCALLDPDAHRRATSTSTTRPTSCPSSSWPRATHPTMAPWRKRLFIATSLHHRRRRRALRPAAGPDGDRRLPHRAVIIRGSAAVIHSRLSRGKSPSASCCTCRSPRTLPPPGGRCGSRGRGRPAGWTPRG